MTPEQQVKQLTISTYLSKFTSRCPGISQARIDNVKSRLEKSYDLNVQRTLERMNDIATEEIETEWEAGNESHYG